MVSRFRTVLLSLLCALALCTVSLASTALVATAEAEESEVGLGLVYVDQSEVALGATQSVAVIAEEGAPALAGAKVTLAKLDGSVERTIEAAKVVDDAALVEMANDDAALAGDWHVTKVEFAWQDGSRSAVDLADAEDLAFTLGTEPAQEADAEEGVETYYTALDDDDNPVTTDDLDETLDEAIGAEPQALSTQDADDADMTQADVEDLTLKYAVVALDPGHGGEDSGAGGIGFLEKDANWKISMATKEWLEARGVRVYVTHSQNETPNPSIYNRVQRAVKAGACVFISQHNNSSPGGTGFEIYIPRDSSYNRQTYTEGKALADVLAPKLADLGLKNRGIKTRLYEGDYYPNGATSDYYGITRYARRNGIPGILIEHAFVDTESDAAKLRDDAFLKKLGVADAEAIYARLDSLYNTYRVYKGLPSIEEVKRISAEIDGQPSGSVFRLYNKWSNEHFYTTSANEAKTNVISGWTYENVGWVDSNEGTPVYRLFNKWTGEHLYTTSKSEYDGLGEAGWKQEDAVFHAVPSSDEGVAPVYRLYNPYTDQHIFTTSRREYWDLSNRGWKGEYLAFCGIAAPGWTPDGPDVPAVPDKPEEPEVPDTPGDPNASDNPANPNSPDLSNQPVVPVDPKGDTPIMGRSATSEAKLRDFFASSMLRYGKVYPALYASKGAATPQEFVDVLWEEATAEGVRPDVLLAQVINETGWLQFGGDVKVDQCNFGGIGATGGGVRGNVFKDVREGLRAQTQHLKAYASKEPLVNACVDPRFGYVQRGCAPTVNGLTGHWAASSSYAESLTSLLLSFPNDLA